MSIQKHIRTTFIGIFRPSTSKGGMLMKRAIVEGCKKSSMKGGITMKTSENRGLHQVRHTMKLGVLSLALSIIMGFTYATPAMSAMNHPHNFGWYAGMASLAEKEVKEQQQVRAAQAEIKIVKQIVTSGGDGTNCLRESTETATKK